MKFWIYNFLLFVLFLFILLKVHSDWLGLNWNKISAVIAVVITLQTLWWIHNKKPQIHDWFEKWF